MVFSMLVQVWLPTWLVCGVSARAKWWPAAEAAAAGTPDSCGAESRQSTCTLHPLPASWQGRPLLHNFINAMKHLLESRRILGAYRLQRPTAWSIFLSLVTQFLSFWAIQNTQGFTVWCMLVQWNDPQSKWNLGCFHSGKHLCNILKR